MKFYFNREIKPQPITQAVIVLNLHEARALYAHLCAIQKWCHIPDLLCNIKDSLKPAIEED